MKYKVTAVGLSILVVLLSILVKLNTDPSPKRYEQHLDAPEKAVCTEHGEERFCTHLPIVEIETDGVEIPGKAIMDKHGKILGHTTTEDGQDLIEARIRIVDHAETRNHTDDASDLESKITIHVRGNSSRTFDKSSYAIELVTEDGENNPQSVMGMDPHHEWIMHGPYLDKTLMRNYMWYNLAGEIMNYAPNVRFCEAFVNGEYKGVYVMVERITAGKNGARLNLEVNRKQNTYSGYLLRLDRDARTPLREVNSFTKYGLRRVHEIEIRYPGEANLTPEIQKSITQDFSDFEKALYSYDFDNDEYGYEDFIDVDSFVDYFILNEFTCNYDAGWLSTYIYKDIDGKYRMCIWDFNSACDNYQQAQMNYDDFEFQNCLWYWMLMKDDAFNKRIIERYRELREGILSDEALCGYIDDVIAYLGDAIDRNYDVWGYTFGEDYYLLKPEERNPQSYEDAVEAMKAFIKVRGEHMDESIETILQFSADSKMKKFIENAN